MPRVLHFSSLVEKVFDHLLFYVNLHTMHGARQMKVHELHSHALWHQNEKRVTTLSRIESLTTVFAYQPINWLFCPQPLLLLLLLILL